ncbi:MAG: transglutaminase domain-containing protein [Nannocystaceae bacterium]
MPGLFVVLLAALLLIAAAFSTIAAAILGAPAEAPTIDALVARAVGLRGWDQVAQVQRDVHAAMPEYGFDNAFDTPRQALARGRGYCWQRASVLRIALRRLGVEADRVHAFLNRFEGHVSGHVWLRVTVDGEARWVCPGDPRGRPGVVGFTPITRVRRWGPGILALTYLGSPIANVFAFIVHLVGRGPPLARGARPPLRLRLLRCGAWTLAPILAWNLALAARLPPVFSDDAAIPGALRLVEALGRVFVVGAPFALILGADDRWRRRGLVLYLVGALAYFASWLPPLLGGAPSWIWIGPWVLPALWLVGIGLMAGSGAYLVGATVFAIAHAIHGVIALGGLLG